MGSPLLARCNLATLRPCDDSKTSDESIIFQRSAHAAICPCSGIGHSSLEPVTCFNYLAHQQQHEIRGASSWCHDAYSLPSAEQHKSNLQNSCLGKWADVECSAWPGLHGLHKASHCISFQCVRTRREAVACYNAPGNLDGARASHSAAHPAIVHCVYERLPHLCMPRTGHHRANDVARLAGGLDSS